MTRASSLLAILLAGAMAFAGDDPYADLPVEPGQPWPQPKPAPTTHAQPVTPPPTQVKPPEPKAPPPPDLHAPPVEPTPPTFFGKDIYSKSGSVIYVIDTSGSMELTDGQPRSRIEIAKQELLRSIAALPSAMRFDVIRYDCQCLECFGQPQPADQDHVAKATAWVAKLTPGGATGTGPAVQDALLRRSNKLILVLTDGAPNCGAGPGEDNDPLTMEAHLSQVRNSNEQAAEIDVFGIHAYGSFRDFCVRLAAQNHGSYKDVR